MPQMGMRRNASIWAACTRLGGWRALCSVQSADAASGSVGAVGWAGVPSNGRWCVCGGDQTAAEGQARAAEWENLSRSGVWCCLCA